MSATSGGNEREVDGRPPSDEDNGKAMPFVRDFRVLAKDEVRRMVSDTQIDMVLVMVSLRLRPSRSPIMGEGGE